MKVQKVYQCGDCAKVWRNQSGAEYCCAPAAGGFTPRQGRRIKDLSPTRRKFFVTILADRIGLADKFADTKFHDIVNDCLFYAEVKKLNIKKELEAFNAPIPADISHNKSSAAQMITHSLE